MRFLAIYRTTPERVCAPLSEKAAVEMQQLIERTTRAGTLLATGGVLPNPKGAARVRRSGGKITIKDGPFTESKELIAGFAVLEATSREHAIELTTEFLEVVGEGESEIHELAMPPAAN
jgi:hypothetical protein